MKNSEAWLKRRIAKILLATDLQQSSKQAMSFAARLSHFFDSAFSSLYVFEFGPHGQAVERLDHVPSMERKAAQQALSNFVAEAGYPNVPAEVVVDEMYVTSAIIKTLAEKSIDLLVIGTESTHKGLGHLLLGSNTESLMLGSGRPVLTVGPNVPEPLDQELRCNRVIYISDFSIASTAAASYAFALSEAFGVEVEIYQLASVAARNDDLKLKRTAEQFCDLLRFADPDLPLEFFDPDFHLSRIVSEKKLMATASEPSNLLVLGVQPASFLQRHLHASLAYRLLANAASPVLTVPLQTIRSDMDER